MNTKQRIRFWIAGALISGAALTPVAQAQTTGEASPFALVAEAGTAGIGASVLFTVSPKVTITLGYTGLNHSYDVESDDGEYDGTLKLSNFKATANWHPWGGAFHFSGGVFVSDNKIDVTAKLKGNNTYEINGTEYNSTQLRSLTGEVNFEEDVAPYVGLGWSKPPGRSGFGFYATLGMYFSGDAEAKLNATGPITSDPAFQANLRAEEEEINEDLEDLAVYPVLQLGVLYRF